MGLEARRVVRRATRWLLRRWLLRNRSEKLDIAEMVAYFSEDVTSVYRRLPKLLLGEDKAVIDKRYAALIEEGVPTELALRIASVRSVSHALNIIELANLYHEEVFRVAKIYFMIADRLHLFRFREIINAFSADDHWAVLARAVYKGDLDWIQRELTVHIFLNTKSRSIPGKIKEWLQKHQNLIQRWENILTDLRSTESKNFALLFVAMRALRDLVGSIM